jgi:hypothetical protein
LLSIERLLAFDREQIGFSFGSRVSPAGCVSAMFCVRSATRSTSKPGQAQERFVDLHRHKDEQAD